jgi:hypothetical protein
VSSKSSLFSDPNSAAEIVVHSVFNFYSAKMWVTKSSPQPPLYCFDSVFLESTLPIGWGKPQGLAKNTTVPQGLPKVSLQGVPEGLPKVSPTFLQGPKGWTAISLDRTEVAIGDELPGSMS